MARPVSGLIAVAQLPGDGTVGGAARPSPAVGQGEQNRDEVPHHIQSLVLVGQEHQDHQRHADDRRYSDSQNRERARTLGNIGRD